MNLNPADKFKGKDLLGPLKYLDPKQNELDLAEKTEGEFVVEPSDGVTATSKFESPINAKERTASIEVHANSPDPLYNSKYTEFVLDMPLVVQRKPYLRHIKFYVKPNRTIYVVAPMNRSLDIIKKEISEHKEWVEKCNQKFQVLKDKFPVKRFLTGEAFPILGEKFILKIQPADFKKPFLQMDLDQLQYYYPENWDLKPEQEKEELLKKYLKKFYHELAVTHLNQRLRILSEKTQLFPKRLTFRNQKTRWGSCSSDGSLNLNWKLVAFDQNLIDYVIIHELCHITHPNHSRRFWTLVESFCPDYKRLNKQLNQLQFEVDFLAAESELYFSNPSIV